VHHGFGWVMRDQFSFFNFTPAAVKSESKQTEAAQPKPTKPKKLKKSERLAIWLALPKRTRRKELAKRPLPEKWIKWSKSVGGLWKPGMKRPVV
jgi:hypothetical protein